jgi:hypothetical protein
VGQSAGKQRCFFESAFFLGSSDGPESTGKGSAMPEDRERGGQDEPKYQTKRDPWELLHVRPMGWTRD